MGENEPRACGNCRYIEVFGHRMFCHRYPPAPAGSGWPHVDRDDWCGEWKQRAEERDDAR